MLRRLLYVKFLKIAIRQRPPEDIVKLCAEAVRMYYRFRALDLMARVRDLVVACLIVVAATVSAIVLAAPMLPLISFTSLYFIVRKHDSCSSIHSRFRRERLPFSSPSSSLSFSFKKGAEVYLSELSFFNLWTEGAKLPQYF